MSQRFLAHFDNSWSTVAGVAPTTVSGATLSNAQSKFGGYSANFIRASSQYVTYATTDFPPSTGDMTVEFWIRLDSIGVLQRVLGFANNAGGNDGYGWFFRVTAGDKVEFVHINSGGVVVSSSTTVTTGTWYHIAGVKEGTQIRLYVNGTQEGTPGTVSVASTAYLNPFSIGRFGAYSGDYFNGYIDELRISASCRYTSNFTPPVEAFSDTAGPLYDEYDEYYDNVVLLMHMDGADDGITFTDVKGKTVTKTGTVVTKTAEKKFGTASAYFNESVAHLRLADSEDWSFGTGDFTIECWFKQAATGSSYALLSQRTSATSSNAFYFYVGATAVTFTASTSGTSLTYTVTKAHTQDTTTWHHVAFVRSAGVGKVYVDGVGGSSLGMSGSIFNSLQNLYIGATNNGNADYFNGYIDEIRITNGVARYLSDFTPPTVVFPDKRDNQADPYFDNVALLLHMEGVDDGLAFPDVTGKTVTRVGNVATKTAAKKFGIASAYFDGTSDALYVTDNAFAVGSGDFTAECWFYVTSVAADRTILSTRSSTAGVEGFSVYIQGSATGVGSLGIIESSGTTTSGSGVTDSLISVNTWYHLALQKTSGVSRLYLNGYLVKVFPQVYAFDSTTFIVGATYFDGTGSFVGYIDDVRFTVGSRYDLGYAIGASDPHWSNVVSLMQFNAASTSNGAFGDVPALRLVNKAGQATISTAQSKFGGSSLLLDGAGDYLFCDDSADWDFGAGDFTVELWFRHAVGGAITEQYLLSQRGGDSLSIAWGLYLQSGSPGSVRFGYSTSGTAYADSAVSPSTTYDTNWHHVAAVRNGTSLKVYLDGVGGVSLDIGTATIFNSVSALNIGTRLSSAGYFNGNIDDLRITKGVARYTADFTPPVSANPVPNFVAPTTAFPNYEESPSGLIEASLTALTASLEGGYFALESTIPAVTGELVGNHVIESTLPVITGAFEGNYGIDATLPVITSDMIGDENSGYVTAGLPVITAVLDSPNVSGTVEATLPATTGIVDALYISTTLNLTLPKITCNAFYAEPCDIPGVELPSLTSSITALNGSRAVASGTLPTGSFTSTGGIYRLTATLPSIDGVLSGFSSDSSSAHNELPALTSEITGQAGRIASLHLTLPVMTSGTDGASNTPVYGDVSGRLSHMRGSLSGVGSNFITITAALPSLETEIDAFTETRGTVSGSLTSMTALLRGDETLTTFELTQVTNTLTTAVTTFDNFQFNSMVEFNGRYFGANDSGLFEIDDAASVEARNGIMTTNQIHFGSEFQKRVSDFYIGMRSEGDVTLRVRTDEDTQYEYGVETHLVDRLKQRRTAIGKGLRGKYWEFELECSDDFEFDTMNITAVPVSRRL